MIELTSVRSQLAKGQRTRRCIANGDLLSHLDRAPTGSTHRVRVDVQAGPAGIEQGQQGRGFPVAVEINPQAKLVGGGWVEKRGATTRSGILSSAVVDFFGGQGDRPSLGGQFTLSADEIPVYRVNLPATLLTTAR